MMKKLEIKLPYAKNDICICAELVDFLEYIQKLFFQYAILVDIEKQEIEKHITITVSFEKQSVEVVSMGKCIYRETIEKMDILHALKCVTTLICNIVKAEEGVGYFHGSVIQVNKKNFLFLGFSGAGKTTLATYLCHQPETKYVSEDVSIIDCTSLQTTEFLRPLFIREESYSILTTEYSIPLSAPYDDFFKRYVYVPEDWSESGKGTLDACFVLDFKKDSEMYIEEQIGDQRVRPYIECAYLCSGYKHNIANAIQIANRLPTFKLTYSDMNEVYRALYQYERERPNGE